MYEELFIKGTLPDTQILSRRLDKYLPQLIIDNQQDDVQKRQGYHNIRRVLNVHEKHDAKDSKAVS